VFNPPYLHIGGDETPRAHWKECPRCRATLGRIGSDDLADLRVHFLNRVDAFCRDTLGVPTISWTEGVSGRMPRDQIVHAWFPGEAATAARLGYDTINSNHEWTYLDYPPSTAVAAHKPAWMLVLPLEKVYHFDPLPEGLEARHADRVLGSEAPLWTEHAPDPAALEAQLMPRLVAFAEALWSPRLGRNFDEFRRRLLEHQRLGTLDLGMPDLAEPVVAG
jgi:hexosaminidase